VAIIAAVTRFTVIFANVPPGQQKFDQEISVQLFAELGLTFGAFWKAHKII